MENGVDGWSGDFSCVSQSSPFAVLTTLLFGDKFMLPRLFNVCSSRQASADFLYHQTLHHRPKFPQSLRDDQKKLP